jgi:quercetin dioxygenase-like cupin family protein
MAIPHADSGIPVDLRPLGEAITETKTTALVKNDTFEAIRLVIPRGREICHDHQVEGVITVHCLEGRIAFIVKGRIQELPAGHWLFLTGGVPHKITGLEDSVALLTVIFR